MLQKQLNLPGLSTLVPISGPVLFSMHAQCQPRQPLTKGPTKGKQKVTTLTHDTYVANGVSQCNRVHRKIWKTPVHVSGNMELSKLLPRLRSRKHHLPPPDHGLKFVLDIHQQARLRLWALFPWAHPLACPCDPASSQCRTAMSRSNLSIGSSRSSSYRKGVSFRWSRPPSS